MNDLKWGSIYSVCEKLAISSRYTQNLAFSVNQFVQAVDSAELAITIVVWQSNNYIYENLDIQSTEFFGDQIRPLKISLERMAKIAILSDLADCQFWSLKQFKFVVLSYYPFF